MPMEARDPPISGLPDTAETDSGRSGADDDVESDPAKGDEETADWSDEGGATPSGPATED